MDQLVILLPESGCPPLDQADISGDTVGRDNDGLKQIDNIWSFIAASSEEPLTYIASPGVTSNLKTHRNH